MSIGGTMRTSVSGMNAQATRLGTVSENIANADTNGYKRSETEFSSLVLPQTKGGYNSGSVEAQVRSFISEQGGLSYTGNSTNSKKLDLAIKGNGFLVVGDRSGGNFLTRAGSFEQQPNGTLVNAAGYTLKGYPITTGGTGYTLNGYAGLQDVNLSAALLNANPTTAGTLTSNLNRDAAAIVAATDTSPGVDGTTASPTKTLKYTSASSITVYDNGGKPLKLDIYYTKTAADTWEVAVYNSAGATTTGASKFPYTAASKLQTGTLVFDSGTAAAPPVPAIPPTYKLKSIAQGGGAAAAVDPTANGNTGNGFLNIDLTGLNGSKVALNITNFTQYSDDFQTLAARVDGNPAEVIDTISTSVDGTVTATFTSGTTRDLYKIPLALVASPDNLSPVAGNAYSAGIESGTVLMGFGGSGGFGNLVAGALEDSNVDLASELTTMIGAQRSYTANSKVFQTGSEILDVLVNLKR
jgi:flagellar hook protein FlgE